MSKELHLGRCLEDLTSSYKIPSVKGKEINHICRIIINLYDLAIKYEKLGDEENAYIYYMKYFGVIQALRALSTQPHHDKSFISAMIGTRDSLNTRIKRLEELQDSLKRRYDRLNKSADMNNNSAVIESIKDESTEEQNRNDEITMIDVLSLFKMIQDKSISILLIDCRPQDDFLQSKINYSSYLNIPEEIIRIGMTAGKIHQSLENQAEKVLFSKRITTDRVILIDWNCKESDLGRDNLPINVLKSILLNFDIDATYNNSILIVNGGYEKFALAYPMHCSNPNFVPMSSVKADNQALDDIEYPSINDISMKDGIEWFRTGDDNTTKLTNNNNNNNYNNNNNNNTILDHHRRKPRINRTNKAAALICYEKKELSDLLHDQETLAEKQLNTNKQLLNAEQEWQKCDLMRDSAAFEKDREHHTSREQELLYQILQLENNKKDYLSQNEQLRSEMEEMKKEKSQAITDIERAKEEARRETIAAIRLEEERLNRKRKILEEERKSKLQVARQQQQQQIKRSLSNAADVIITPTPTPTATPTTTTTSKVQPQFDRTVKPSKNIVAYPESTVQRDFAPEPGSIGLGLTGLKNLGNTCYMNSIIQCLSNTNRLVEYFISDYYKRDINRTNQTQGRIAEEVSAVIKELWNGHYKCIACHNLRMIVGQFHSMFRGYEQHDSHEFLTILMDWLHSDLQTQVDAFPKENLPPSERAWQEFVKSKESHILQLFYGQIKSTVKCVVCNKESATYEGFSNLSLELPQNSNRCDIEDCLDMYFYGERISDWNCPSCKVKRDAIKKLDISRLPPILVIHFKRFCASIDYNPVYKKKQNYVRFPLNNLDVQNYVARKERNRRNAISSYNLYGVSNHYGTMESGHYTAFCKSNVHQKWFKFDDQTVTQLDPSDVVSSGAYILFYAEASKEISKM